jgi:hypothetical protein
MRVLSRYATFVRTSEHLARYTDMHRNTHQELIFKYTTHFWWKQCFNCGTLWYKTYIKQTTANISPTVPGISNPTHNSCTLYQSLYHAHLFTDNSIVFEINLLIYFHIMHLIWLPDFNHNLAVLSTFSNMPKTNLTEYLFTGSQVIKCRKLDEHGKGKVTGCIFGTRTCICT